MRRHHALWTALLSMMATGLEPGKKRSAFVSTTTLDTCAARNCSCIIQDCAEDWARESAMMDKVYARSVCTIAATASSDGTMGLFRKRNLAHILPNVVQGTRDGRPLGHCSFRNEYGRDEVGDAPLNKRGWTLQEMFLSNRIIHFADKRKCSGNVQPMLVRPPSQAFILQTCSGTGRRTRGMVCIPSSV